MDQDDDTSTSFKKCENEIEFNKLLSNEELLENTSKESKSFRRSKRLKAKIIAEKNILSGSYSLEQKSIPRKILKSGKTTPSKCIGSNLLTNYFVFNAKGTDIEDKVVLTAENISKCTENLQNVHNDPMYNGVNDKLLVEEKCSFRAFKTKKQYESTVIKRNIELSVEKVKNENQMFASVIGSEDEKVHNLIRPYHRSKNTTKSPIVMTNTNSSEYSSSFIQTKVKKSKKCAGKKNKELKPLNNYLVKETQPAASETEIAQNEETRYLCSSVRQQVINSHDDFSNFEVVSVNVVNSGISSGKNMVTLNLNHKTPTVNENFDELKLIEADDVNDVNSYYEKNKKPRKTRKKKCTNYNASNSLTNYFVNKSKPLSSENEVSQKISKAISFTEISKNIEEDNFILNDSFKLQSENDLSKTFSEDKNTLIQHCIDNSDHKLTVCKISNTLVGDSGVALGANNKKSHDAQPGHHSERQKCADSESISNNILDSHVSKVVCKRRKKKRIEIDECTDLNRSILSTSTEKEPLISEIYATTAVKNSYTTEENINNFSEKLCADPFGTESQLEIPENTNVHKTAKFTVKSRTNKKYNKIKTAEHNHDLEVEVVQSISERRQSLRRRGLRKGENSSQRKFDDKQNIIVDKQNKFGKKINDDKDVCEAVQENIETDFVHETKVQRKKNTTKKEKTNLKLFPIFSSKSNINASSNKTLKRKVEDSKGYTDQVPDKIIKKTKAICKRSDTETNKRVESVCGSKEKNNKSESCCDNIQEIVINSDRSDILVAKNALHKQDNIKPTLERKKTATPKMTDKQKFLNQHLISFPLFSHINVGDNEFHCASSKIKRFTINEDIQSEEVIPDLKSNIGLIHRQDIQMLKEQLKSVPKRCRDQISKTGVSNKNLLWTDSTDTKLSTEQENCDSIKEIKSWLLDWKTKFNASSKISSFNKDDYFPSDSEDDCISNGIIISGPPGTGKTSVVFALAKELGFTVLEVNASSCRNGRSISNQLKEALESYHVESVKIDSFSKETILEKKNNKDKCDLMIENPDLTKTKGILSFFTASTSHSKKNNTLNKEKTIGNFFHSVNKNVEKGNASSKSTNESGDSSEKTEPDFEKSSCKISGLTIILFDDVDVIFDEDEGFWSTVKGFLKISKKPVIFTVGRNLSVIKSILNNDIQVFHMRPSSREEAVKTIQECCKEHSKENSSVNLELLTSHNVYDIRRNILNTQFWTQLPIEFEETSDLDFNSCNLPKSVCVNSFITGAVQFSTDHVRKLLCDALPNNLLSTVVEYHNLGYDILFNNIFKIIYALKPIPEDKLWKDWTLKFQNSSSNLQSFSDSEMWKEACAVFDQKKKALKSGSSSQELQMIADALDDFSFADSLKGLSHRTFQLLSTSERIKLWTAGQPVCFEQNSSTNENLFSIISLIHIYQLRKVQSITSIKYSDKCGSIQLELEHPLFCLDKSFAFKTENELENISLVLPSSYLLNRSALILDYLSTIKIICQNEENRQLKSGKRSGRFFHYFDSISLYVDRKKIF